MYKVKHFESPHEFEKFIGNRDIEITKVHFEEPKSTFYARLVYKDNGLENEIKKEE